MATRWAVYEPIVNSWGEMTPIIHGRKSMGNPTYRGSFTPFRTGIGANLLKVHENWRFIAVVGRFIGYRLWGMTKLRDDFTLGELHNTTLCTDT